VVVIGPDLQVRVWNRRCEDLWGLRAEEAVGQHFLNLDIGLPTDLLRPMIRQLLGSENGSSEARLPSVIRRAARLCVETATAPPASSW
jgi:two-component system CheB/CheR fusion protein